MTTSATRPSTTRLAPAPGTAQAVMTDLREFLAFKIGNEEYGVDILRVQEIRTYEKPTTIANATGELLGVMNLRGVIVPIIDLRLKLGQTAVQYDHLKVVIVLHIGQRTVGVVVDGVSDVLILQPSQISAAPQFGSAFSTEHLTGIGTVGERMLILVDIEKLMTSEEMALVEEAVA